jgi:hypothetical protein
MAWRGSAVNLSTIDPPRIVQGGDESDAGADVHCEGAPQDIRNTAVNEATNTDVGADAGACSPVPKAGTSVGRTAPSGTEVQLSVPLAGVHAAGPRVTAAGLPMRRAAVRSSTTQFVAI